MGLIENITNFFRVLPRETGRTSTESPSPRTTGGYDWTPFSRGGMNVATAYRCVNLLADSVANLPMRYLTLSGGVFTPALSHSLYYLLNVQPDVHLSAVDFWRLTVQHLLLQGNAYIVPVYEPTIGEYTRLALIQPQCVAHDTVNDTYTINDTVAGISGVYSEGEIIHLKNYSIDGKRGISTVAYARTALDIAHTGDQEALDRFTNGGAVKGFVGNDTQGVRGFGEYQDKQLENTAKSLDDKFRGGNRIVHLPGQVSFQSISMSAADMQFLESRKFGVREICRFFGVHPSFVFDDTSNNYKSAEMANVAFLSNTLNPLLRKIEVEFLRKLVPRTNIPNRRFEFDRRSLYACDLDSRVKYQTQMLSAGLATVNELRQEENRPPVGGGDRVLVSANLKSIEELTAPNVAITQNSNE